MKRISMSVTCEHLLYQICAVSLHSVHALNNGGIVADELINDTKIVVKLQGESMKN